MVDEIADNRGVDHTESDRFADLVEFELGDDAVQAVIEPPPRNPGQTTWLRPTTSICRKNCCRWAPLTLCPQRISSSSWRGSWHPSESIPERLPAS